MSRLRFVRWAGGRSSGTAAGVEPDAGRYRKLDGGGSDASAARRQTPRRQSARRVHAVEGVPLDDRRGDSRDMAVSEKRAGQAIRQQVGDGGNIPPDLPNGKTPWPLARRHLVLQPVSARRAARAIRRDRLINRREKPLRPESREEP